MTRTYINDKGQTVEAHTCAVCGHPVENIKGTRGRPKWYHPQCQELQKALGRVIDLIGEGAKVGGQVMAVRFADDVHAKRVRSLLFSTVNTATNRVVLGDYYERNRLEPIEPTEED